jgi:hypothetical protein
MANTAFYTGVCNAIYCWFCFQLLGSAAHHVIDWLLPYLAVDDRFN